MIDARTAWAMGRTAWVLAETRCINNQAMAVARLKLIDPRNLSRDEFHFWCDRLQSELDFKKELDAEAANKELPRCKTTPQPT